MIIDDHAVVRNGVRKALEQRGGFHIFEAASRAEALAQIAKTNPSLIIVDLNLPDGNGLEIVQSKEFKHYRVNTINTHGTGCSLASAIATYLAAGHDLAHSVAKAIAYVEAGLEAGRFLSIGEGPGPLWHMHDFYPTALLDEKEKR